MTGQPNVAPIIIKRKKVSGGDGHHGGAWKVAYADFVTAMMAFFMMMWLLNATTEDQKRGIADYFSPTVTINRQSGGGDGMFSGNTVFTEDVLAQNGRGATQANPTSAAQARGLTGAEDGSQADQSAATFRMAQEALNALSGESLASDQLLRHIFTRVTDEGLVIELFDIPDAPLFEKGTAKPTPLLRDLAVMLERVTGLVRNDVALAGFVRSNPLVQADNPVWPLSAARADQVRALLTDAGVAPQRIKRVTGHADRSPVVDDPMSIRNNRIELTLLRH